METEKTIVLTPVEATTSPLQAPLPRENGDCFRRGRGFGCPLHLDYVCPALPVGARSGDRLRSFCDFRPAMGSPAGPRDGSHSRDGSISLVGARRAFDHPLRRHQEASQILNRVFLNRMSISLSFCAASAGYHLCGFLSACEIPHLAQTDNARVLPKPLKPHCPATVKPVCFLEEFLEIPMNNFSNSFSRRSFLAGASSLGALYAASKFAPLPALAAGAAQRSAHRPAADCRQRFRLHSKDRRTACTPRLRTVRKGCRRGATADS